MRSAFPLESVINKQTSARVPYPTGCSRAGIGAAKRASTHAKPTDKPDASALKGAKVNRAKGKLPIRMPDAPLGLMLPALWELSRHAGHRWLGVTLAPDLIGRGL